MGEGEILEILGYRRSAISGAILCDVLDELTARFRQTVKWAGAVFREWNPLPRQSDHLVAQFVHRYRI